jgi:transcription-repair coupling factor (superfamily II helicase)
MLSRFKTAAEQKEIAKRAAAGEADILVGTHRLLGSDVKFKDLGLLVIDEEQRFGVAHKEQLKKLKTNVDVLTLSATPIPRTLHMSMAGIRDMSLIETPPEERYPVQTYVLDYSDTLVRDAILRELARGGQAYVVYNRVKNIDLFHKHLRELVPEARIVVGHGQMRENALEDVMLDFFEGRYDVLLCSTIIESGLDVPNCNTMIVCEANRFGLSQLYQLRGRVGRSNRLAYCYLTVLPGRTIGEMAEKRLTAIREFTEFGSGFKIAMRDLEIRGAGNILGAEQHGHMSAVGYDLYVKMMEEAVRKLRGEKGLGDIETRVDLKIDAYLPEDYVRGDGVRLEVYKRIASIDGKGDRDDVIEELIDRFGDVPDPVYNLVAVSYFKHLCLGMKIEQALMRAGKLTLRFSPGADIDPMALIRAMADQPQWMLSASEPPSLIFREEGEPDALMKRATLPLEALVNGIAALRADVAN